ncbi:sigma-70 family RNA polymerase sigma factor, partial [Candidatus Bipolaricaulota bacterium]|nr:sigma-70 family RNA polymerase sigma factor [Candidatus Bipolaricaulota bacterium]
MPDTHDLLARVARRDARAFRALYTQYADRVFRYALTLLHNRHLAEEVAQETMVAVWKGAGSFSGRSQVSTWIFGIARNQAHTLLRREVKGERR